MLGRSKNKFLSPSHHQLEEFLLLFSCHHFIFLSFLGEVSPSSFAVIRFNHVIIPSFFLIWGRTSSKSNGVCAHILLGQRRRRKNVSSSLLLKKKRGINLGRGERALIPSQKNIRGDLTLRDKRQGRKRDEKYKLRRDLSGK